MKVNGESSLFVERTLQTRIPKREIASKKLEIGPGEHLLKGFDTLDCVDRTDLTFQAAWGEERLPIEDKSYDYVFASHVLEHVPWNRTIAALAEVYRILVPGGDFEVWVPDFAYIVECYTQRRCGDNWRRDNPLSHPMRWVNGRIFTYGPGAENWHRACFDEHFLRECLQTVGFRDVVRLRLRTRGTSHGPIDLGIKATKR